MEIKSKVVCAMKTLKVLYNEGAKKFWSKQLKKNCKRKFEFFIDLATLAMLAVDTKSREDEPQNNKAGCLFHNNNNRRGAQKC